MLRIKVKSHRFYAETEFRADASLLAEFAEELNRLFETLDGEAELEGVGYNRLKFKAMHGGHIFVSGTLSMNENGQSHEMTFSNSIDQTYLQGFAKKLFADYCGNAE